jgi:hypothetical protein
MMKSVPCFGVHVDEDGVKWLMQKAGGENAIGLKEAAPFDVQQIRRKCNHEIPLARGQWQAHEVLKYENLDEDELIRLMSPIPRTEEGTFFVEETGDNRDMMITLSRLSSPVMSSVRPIYAFNDESEIYEWVNRSNIQPLVLFRMQQDSTVLMRELAQSCKNSKSPLIFMGPKNLYLPSGVKKISKLPELPKTAEWETIGAGILYSWMRNDNH